MHGNGWVGVDLFFVLSGFLITGILYDTLPDRYFFRNFHARRTLRIFPLYYAFVALLLVVSRFTHDNWYPGIWNVLTYTENLPLGLVRVTDAVWININHFWSLAVEEQFYVVWPLLVFVLGTRRRILIAAVSGVAFSFLSRVYWVNFTNMLQHEAVVYWWTPSCLDGLLAGALLAMVYRSVRWRARFLSAGPAVLGVGCLGLAAILFTQGTLDWEGKPFVSVVLPTLLAFTFSGLLLCCLRPKSLVQNVFGNAVLRFFGRYSYGLYMFHYTLGAAVGQPLRVHLLAEHRPKLFALLASAGASLALSVAAAWLSFRYFELPFLRLKDRFTNRSHRPRLGEEAAASRNSTAVIGTE